MLSYRLDAANEDHWGINQFSAAPNLTYIYWENIYKFSGTVTKSPNKHKKILYSNDSSNIW